MEGLPGQIRIPADFFYRNALVRFIRHQCDQRIREPLLRAQSRRIFPEYMTLSPICKTFSEGLISFSEWFIIITNTYSCQVFTEGYSWVKY